MTHREIAEQLGVSTMTVFNDIQSATCKIHAYLTKGDPDAKPMKVTRSSVNKKKRNKETTQMSNLIDISKMDKAEVLQKLWNRAINNQNHGLAFLLQGVQSDMSLETAQSYVRSNPRLYFDYVDGRCMKVDLSGDMLNPTSYDRDCGQGAAARALGAEP